MNHNKGFKRHFAGFCTAVGLLLLTGLGFLLVRNVPEFPASFLGFSSFVNSFISVLTGWLPFSVSELFLLLLILAVPIGLIASFIVSLRRRSVHPVLTWAVTVFVTGSYLLFQFFWTWGFSYYAPSLSSRLSLPTPDTSEESLFELCSYLTEELNTLASSVPRDSDGNVEFGTFEDQSAMVSEAASSFFEENPFLHGSAVPVKPILLSDPLSYTGITGIYICITGESNVNTCCPEVLLPFTMAHETAHRAAIAPEDEANFVAFLICSESDLPSLQYSAYYQTWIYCTNALGKVNPTLQSSLYDRLNPLVFNDFASQREWSSRYAGSTQKKVEKINDQYLKTMNQASGVQSYTEVVNLLLSWYQSQNR